MIVDSFDDDGWLGFLEIIQSSHLTLFFIQHLTPPRPPLYTYTLPCLMTVPRLRLASASLIMRQLVVSCRQGGITCLSSPLALIQQNNLTKWPQEKHHGSLQGGLCSITPRGGEPREAFVESHGKIRHSCCCCIWLAAFWQNSWNQIIPITVNV